MISELAVWAIFFMPLLAFVTIVAVIRPFLNRYDSLSGYIAIATIGTSFALSVWSLTAVWSNPEGLAWGSHHWLSVGDLEINFGIMMDPLSSVMVVVISGVSLAVQVYSQGYMDKDPGYSRYFAFMTLFTASMLGLVLASSIIQLYVFWELVGMCSYLLIGFWYHRPAAAAAAKKAFIVTRLGDFGFLLAILYLFLNRSLFFEAGLNPLEIADINKIAHGAEVAVALGGGVITWVSIGIFAGAVGKSAQFPLHVWLPDAMEGPTPVSALIHAATMVVAGVFLVARFFPLFEQSDFSMNVVALVGGFTAIFAATMGLVMNDIKRVLAYSTISQLGYMMLALGVGAYGAAIFHLFNHAFFKALLFLGSGSVNHATGTFNMRFMGGLKNHMRWTYITFLIASLSISGIFPLAGFWSKDEILTGAWNKGDAIGYLVFAMAITAAFMTSFYMFRALFITFHGEFRGGVDAELESGSTEHSVHLGESPKVMIIPLALLAIPSIVSGFLANPINSAWGLGIVPVHWFSKHMEHVPLVSAHAAEFSFSMALTSTVVASLGIMAAYLIYARHQVDPEVITNRIKGLYNLVYRKYYFDEIYEDWVTKKGLYGILAGSLDWFDKNIINRIGDIVGFLGRNVGKVVSLSENGQIQTYGAAISLGIIVIMVSFLF